MMRYPEDRRHGTYRILRSGDLFVVIADDAWNRETAQAFLADFRPAFEALPAGRKWGVIFDLRSWGLLTPDALEALLPMVNMDGRAAPGHYALLTGSDAILTEALAGRLIERGQVRRRLAHGLKVFHRVSSLREWIDTLELTTADNLDSLLPRRDS